MAKNMHHGDYGMTITFRHPDGRLRSDFAVGQPLQAVRELLDAHPEPWKVVCISHPQTIYADLIGRKRGNGGSVPTPPELNILQQLGERGRLA